MPDIPAPNPSTQPATQEPRPPQEPGSTTPTPTQETGQPLANVMTGEAAAETPKFEKAKAELASLRDELQKMKGLLESGRSNYGEQIALGLAQDQAREETFLLEAQAELNKGNPEKAKRLLLSYYQEKKLAALAIIGHANKPEKKILQPSVTTPTETIPQQTPPMVERDNTDVVDAAAAQAAEPPPTPTQHLEEDVARAAVVTEALEQTQKDALPIEAALKELGATEEEMNSIKVGEVSKKIEDLRTREAQKAFIQIENLLGRKFTATIAEAAFFGKPEDRAAWKQYLKAIIEKEPLAAPEQDPIKKTLTLLKSGGGLSLILLLFLFMELQKE